MRVTAERASMATRWLPRRCLSRACSRNDMGGGQSCLATSARCEGRHECGVPIASRLCEHFCWWLKCSMLSVTLSRVSAWAKWSRASLSCEPEPLRCATNRSAHLRSGFASPPQAKICQSPRRRGTRTRTWQLPASRPASRSPAVFTRGERVLFCSTWRCGAPGHQHVK